MLFRLVNAEAEYDSHTERAYVEFRANDGDGGEIITSAIFTFRSHAGSPNLKSNKKLSGKRVMR